MKKFDLVLYPDKGLTEPCPPIVGMLPNPDIVPEMIRVMEEKHGIGLAGPQVGFPYQIFVARMPCRDTKTQFEKPDAFDDPQVFINPRIAEQTGKVDTTEGCLSLPNILATIVRAERVEIHYRTLEGEEKVEIAEGLRSILFQHEIDHLSGVLLIDRMSDAQKKRFASVIRDLEKGKKS